MNLIFEHFTPGNPVPYDVAKDISDWSQMATGMMLPLTPPKIQNEAFAVVAYDGLAALGHVAITRFEGVTSVMTGNWHVKQEDIGDTATPAAIIGGLVVNPAKTGGQTAHKLIAELLLNAGKHIEGNGGYRAYANPKSLSVFMSLGAQCVGTRAKPESTNCNWVVDLTRAQQKLTAAKTVKMVY